MQGMDRAQVTVSLTRAARLPRLAGTMLQSVKFGVPNLQFRQNIRDGRPGQEELEMRNHMKSAFAATLLLGLLLSGCAQEDRRLAEDQQSCLQMGHSPGTPQFSQCMEDLNQRRCATATAKGIAGRHVATEECTRLK